MDDLTQGNQPRGGKAMVWTGWAMTGVISAMLIMSGVMKLVSEGPKFEEEIAKIGIPKSMIVPLGILELACVAIYLVPQTSIVGVILLTGYLGGAICTHWRVDEAFFVQAILGVVVWLGIYLREPRLRAIMPVRGAP